MILANGTKESLVIKNYLMCRHEIYGIILLEYIMADGNLAVQEGKPAETFIEIKRGKTKSPAERMVKLQGV